VNKKRSGRTSRVEGGRKGGKEREDTVGASSERGGARSKKRLRVEGAKRWGKKWEARNVHYLHRKNRIGVHPGSPARAEPTF
jgi:hypothetical protein